MGQDKYNIIRKGVLTHSNLTEEEYFDIILYLSCPISNHSGSPNSNEIKTEIIQGD